MAWGERLLRASSLVLGLGALGCEDRADDMSDDAGAQLDGGAGGMDAGRDSGSSLDLPTIKCGSKSCEGNVINNRVVDPCCVPDQADDTCGFEADDIKNANPSSPFTGCVPRDVPSASASAYCGSFWDLVEPEGEINGGLDIRSGSARFTFEGCCLPSGECGAKLDTPRGQDESVNSHLGCVSFGRLSAAFSAGDAGAVPQPAKLPYCNTTTGEGLTGNAVVPGQPKFVCGCGEGKLDDGTGTFPCFNDLPVTVCGAADPTAGQLAMIPEFICGCPADLSTAKLPCMINVPEATCGTAQIDANSAVLAKLPEFICGEDPANPTVLPSLKGVDPAVCGTKPVDADSAELSTLPEFICGAIGATPQTAGLPRLRNVEFAVCGKKAIDGDSAELNQVPVFICGAEGAAFSGLPQLLNVPAAVCGKAPVAQDSPYLDGVPAFICGEIGRLNIGLPLLRNVPGNVCGKLPVTTGSPYLADVPEFLCGCTGRVDPKLGCLSNVAKEVCGARQVSSGSPYLANVPKFVCGCPGAGLDNELGPLCLSNVESSVCGVRADAITDRGAVGPSVDDCLTGVPEYAGGCGAIETPAGQRCLRQTPMLPGCDHVAAGPIPRLPEYLCGCGESTVWNGQGVPCLNFVAPTICGAIPMPAAGPVQAQLPTLPVTVCGCGEDTLNSTPAQSLPCLPNLPTSWCGSAAANINPTGGPGSTPCATGYPQVFHGCAAPGYDSVYPIQCIANVAESVFGCP